MADWLAALGEIAAAALFFPLWGVLGALFLAALKPFEGCRYFPAQAYGAAVVSAAVAAILVIAWATSSA